MEQQQQQQLQHMDTFDVISAAMDTTTTAATTTPEDLSVIFLPDDISPELLHASLSHAADWNEISIAPELVNPGFGFNPADAYSIATYSTATSSATSTVMGSPENTYLTSANDSHAGFPFTNNNSDNNDSNMELGPMRHPRRRRSSGASPMMKPYGSPQSNGAAAHSGILSPANLLEMVPEEEEQVLPCATTMSPDMIQTLSQLFAPFHVMENGPFGMMTSFTPLIPVTTADTTSTTATTRCALPNHRKHSHSHSTAADPTFGAMLDHQKRQRFEIEENILSVNYDDVTVTQMKKLLRQSNLPASGKKSELVDRLRREGERLSKQRSRGLAVSEHQQQQQHQHCGKGTPPAVVAPRSNFNNDFNNNNKSDQLLFQPPAFLKSLDSLDAKKDVFQLMRAPAVNLPQTNWGLQRIQ